MKVMDLISAEPSATSAVSFFVLSSLCLSFFLAKLVNVLPSFSSSGKERTFPLW